MQQFRPSRFDVLPTIVKNLLIINGLMYLATSVLESQFGMNITRMMALHYFTSPFFLPHQLLTHMFMHGSLSHIIFNMFALWMFGSLLENYWGPKRFLIYYIICGLGGALLHQGVTAWEINGLHREVADYMRSPSPSGFVTLFEQNQRLLYNNEFLHRANTMLTRWQMEPSNSALVFNSMELAQELVQQRANIPVVGASGAVFGLLLAFGMMFPNTYLYIYFLVPVKAKYFVIFYGLLELYLGVTGTQSGVAHFAHLGGMLFGFLLLRYWNRKRYDDIF